MKLRVSTHKHFTLKLLIGLLLLQVLPTVLDFFPLIVLLLSLSPERFQNGSFVDFGSLRDMVGVQLLLDPKDVSVQIQLVVGCVVEVGLEHFVGHLNLLDLEWRAFAHSSSRS